jgi:hypothetical protein
MTQTEQATRYVVRPRTGKFGDFWSMAELAAAKFCRIRVEKPESPHVPEGEWYCMNPDCIVREVEIRCKLHGKKMPRAFKCPLCGQGPLKFHNWLGTETLVPCEEP